MPTQTRVYLARDLQLPPQHWAILWQHVHALLGADCEESTTPYFDDVADGEVPAVITAACQARNASVDCATGWCTNDPRKVCVIIRCERHRPVSNYIATLIEHGFVHLASCVDPATEIGELGGSQDLLATSDHSIWVHDSAPLAGSTCAGSDLTFVLRFGVSPEDRADQEDIELLNTTLLAPITGQGRLPVPQQQALSRQLRALAARLDDELATVEQKQKAA